MVNFAPKVKICYIFTPFFTNSKSFNPISSKVNPNPYGYWSTCYHFLKALDMLVSHVKVYVTGPVFVPSVKTNVKT